MVLTRLGEPRSGPNPLLLLLLLLLYFYYIILHYYFFCSWKTKIDKISQQIRESCGIQPINQWVERRIIKWNEHVTRMYAERLVMPEKGLQDALKEERAS